jgi:PAS domain S-box-containing protein
MEFLIKPWSPLFRTKCLIAVAAVGVALGLRVWLLGGVGPAIPYLTFYPAVTIAAVFGGVVSGLLATILAAVLARYFFIDPVGSFNFIALRDFLGVVVFIASSIIVTSVCELMLRYRLRISDHARILSENNELLQLEMLEHKNAKTQLENSQSILSHTIDALSAAIISADSEGVVMRFNRKAKVFFGKQGQEVAGLSLFEMVPVTRGDLDAVAKQNKFLRLDKSIVRASTGIRLADIQINHFNTMGSSYFVVVVEDTTERVRFEGLMAHAEKMISVGGLAAGMAHEINNPLAGIMQSAQVILGRLEPMRASNIQIAEQAGVKFDALLGYLNRREIPVLVSQIRESAIRASRIVKSMLELNRESDADRAPTDINELLETSVRLSSIDYDLKKKYDFRRIEIVRDYDPKLPSVSCTASQVEQVFLNLLRNAAQAMSGLDRKGEPPKIILRTRLEDGKARIEIEDNGPGIPEELLGRIFDPFFTTKKPGEGTGLGLSVSYFIITKDHAGTITAESESGNGTKFIICLPLDSPSGEKSVGGEEGNEHVSIT